MDAITQVFKKQEYIDAFHPAEKNGNERLYRHEKARVCQKFLDRQAGKGKNFLDAGAGLGPYTHYGASKFKTVYCFEFDPDELAGAKRNAGLLPNINYQQVDLTRIPLPDNSVDTAICSEVLEHISKHEQAAGELYRVLKPGGRLLFSMPNNNSMFYRRVRRTAKIQRLLRQDLNALARGDWEAVRHVSFSYKDIEKIATSAGFKIVDRQGANITSLPGFLRRLTLSSALLLWLFTRLQDFLARPLAGFGAFYFLELTK